jgi:hypothetical protein
MTGNGGATDTRENLRDEISKVRLALLHARIDALESDNRDFDKRLRPAEEVVTKFNFILYLTMGGGFVGLINLAILIYVLVRALTP